MAQLIKQRYKLDWIKSHPKEEHDKRRSWSQSEWLNHGAEKWQIQVMSSLEKEMCWHVSDMSESGEWSGQRVMSLAIDDFNMMRNRRGEQCNRGKFVMPNSWMQTRRKWRLVIGLVD